MADSKIKEAQKLMWMQCFQKWKLEPVEFIVQKLDQKGFLLEQTIHLLMLQRKAMPVKVVILQTTMVIN